MYCNLSYKMRCSIFLGYWPRHFVSARSVHPNLNSLPLDSARRHLTYWRPAQWARGSCPWHAGSARGWAWCPGSFADWSDWTRWWILGRFWCTGRAWKRTAPCPRCPRFPGSLDRHRPRSPCGKSPPLSGHTAQRTCPIWTELSAPIFQHHRAYFVRDLNSCLLICIQSWITYPRTTTLNSLI